MTNLRVAACKRTSVLPDGSLIEMDLEGSDKEAVTLQFDVDMFDEFLGRLMQLIADARNRKHAKSGQPGVPALPTAAAGAGPTADGSHVILLMKSHTGTDFQFALPTHGAEQLAQHIQTAVAAARQTLQARH
jgi:hypothetical protein